MALSPFGRRYNNSIFDPFSFDSIWDSHGFPSFSSIWDISPARNFAPDISAVARTQVDWKETPEAHIFKADLPGLKKEEIKVQVQDGQLLQISGQRSREETEKTDNWHRMERAEGSFMRQFRLPEDAKVDEIKAAVEDGVLTVTVPKHPQPHPDVKTIDVTG